ncbi:MAG: hemolysin III family protein [Treponema sp.]|jgi:hemolysin III|nr:hemolysin III family protein [Treponema sp.]
MDAYIPRRRKYYPIPPPLPFYTPGEEIAHAVLHGLGSLLAVGGLILLVLRARGLWGGGSYNAETLTAYTVFSATMIALFLISTLYHAIPHEGAKRVFQILDHSAIYLLIAGTYTPFCILVIKGIPGWILFGFEWGLALIGIILYSLRCKTLMKIELGIYVLMGWAIAAPWFRIVDLLPRYSLILLAAGGAAYTLGIHWYRKKNRRGAHAVWHVFVLLGAFCHWWSIWLLN